jgi:YidC/Oxa1 family membrane protein insertase
MPNIRLVIWLALAAVLYLNYEAWNHDYGPADAAASNAAALGTSPAGSASATNYANSVPVPTASSAGAPSASESQPAATVTSNGADGVPSIAAPGAGSPPSAGGAGNAAGAPGALAAGTIRVRTDVLELAISLRGGEIHRADLLKYPKRKDTPNEPVRLLNDDDPNTLYVIQTGLAGEGSAPAPTHLALWTAAADSYTLESGASELRVPLTWTDGQGLTVTKTFVFQPGNYAFTLDYAVKNGGTTARKLVEYSRIERHWEHASRSYFNIETYSFKGPQIFNGTKSFDLNVEDSADSKFDQSATNGWIASLQHHFVSAIVPTPGESFTYQLKVQDKDYFETATGPTINVAPGGATEFSEKLFVGPKLQAQLAAATPTLELAADYGRLTVLAQPLFKLLAWVHALIGNWGWSIIIVTALIKLLFYPLSQASGRSMAKMRAVGPRMKQIQDTYKDDREKLGRAMMDLYKKEKINPLAGCLPMVVQIPFFIAFYWVLVESVEMRQAPFMLWVNDLSARDPYFVLPLLMGGAMFAQFKLNPAPPDPMQAKIMQFMPLVMTAMMAWFPSGLVLYWLTNTVLSIAQQWRVNQVVQSEAAKKRT